MIAESNPSPPAPDPAGKMNSTPTFRAALRDRWAEVLRSVSIIWSICRAWCRLAWCSGIVLPRETIYVGRTTVKEPNGTSSARREIDAWESLRLLVSDGAVGTSPRTDIPGNRCFSWFSIFGNLLFRCLLRMIEPLVAYRIGSLVISADIDGPSCHRYRMAMSDGLAAEGILKSSKASGRAVHFNRAFVGVGLPLMIVVFVGWMLFSDGRPKSMRQSISRSVAKLFSRGHPAAESEQVTSPVSFDRQDSQSMLRRRQPLSEQEEGKTSQLDIKRKRFGEAYGYVNSAGDMLIQPRFLYAGEFRDGIAKVWTENGYGFVDAKGSYLSSSPSGERPEDAEVVEQLEVAQRITGTTAEEVQRSMATLRSMGRSSASAFGESAPPTDSDAMAMVLAMIQAKTRQLAENGATPDEGSVEARRQKYNALVEADAIATRAKAERGDAEAQRSLGQRHLFGLGVPKDPREAAKWTRKAADQGHALAQMSLGLNYLSGQGVPQNPTEAVVWFRKAAQQGEVNAQSLLGTAYAEGLGVDKDPVEAQKWFRKAASQGHLGAQTALELMSIRSKVDAKRSGAPEK